MMGLIFLVYVIFSHLCAGIAFVHLSPSIYTFHDIRRNVADLPSPFLWGKFSILMIPFETKENDDEGYHQLKIDMEK
ncbi:hypothetical protein QL285_071085 [Trifolium repens]|nr:hypothetical protein QL285_071085 [Trifolium repens]